MGFSKIGGLFLGVLFIRIVAQFGLFGGCLIYRNSHIVLLAPRLAAEPRGGSRALEERAARAPCACRQP